MSHPEINDQPNPPLPPATHEQMLTFLKAVVTKAGVIDPSFATGRKKTGSRDPVVAASIAAAEEEVLAARFLLKLDEEHGQDAFYYFLERFTEYLELEENALYKGSKKYRAPVFEFTKEETAVLEMVCAAAKNFDPHRFSRRDMVIVGGATSAIGILIAATGIPLTMSKTKQTYRQLGKAERELQTPDNNRVSDEEKKRRREKLQEQIKALKHEAMAWTWGFGASIVGGFGPPMVTLLYCMLMMENHPEHAKRNADRELLKDFLLIMGTTLQEAHLDLHKQGVSLPQGLSKSS